MPDLATVWKMAAEWDRERPAAVELDGCRAQLFMAAMEIPLVALRPAARRRPTAERMAALDEALRPFGLEVEMVEAGSNYKINRRRTHEYVGRILPEALKLHCERILALGWDVFERIAAFYLGLPAA